MSIRQKSLSVQSRVISDSIPNDLIVQILSRLPAKSVARFHCMSKLWASIIGGPYFTELFLTRSSSGPRLLFALEEEEEEGEFSGVWSLFSLPQPQWSSSSLVAVAKFRTKFSPDNMLICRSRQFSCSFASGLIYFYGMWIKEKSYYNAVPVICNPNTGQYATLPYLKRYRQCYSFLGFDPISKQFKALFMAYPSGPDDHKILTIGTRKTKWRTITCSLKHEILREQGICINGVLYYLGDRQGWGKSKTCDNYVIGCFDVRSEKFKFIFLENRCELINYKGKLGVIFNDSYAGDVFEFRLWVLEDVEKQEWLKYGYTLRYDRVFRDNAFVVGVTACGEIVLSMPEYTCGEPFYVYYFNPIRNNVRRVEIQGFGYPKPFRNQVYTFVDHVEDHDVIDAELLDSIIYAPYVKKEEESEEEDGSLSMLFSLLV